MFAFDARQGEGHSGDDMEPLVAFIAEHTGLSRRVITQVLDANDQYGDRLVERYGFERMQAWAQGEVWDPEEYA